MKSQKVYKMETVLKGKTMCLSSKTEKNLSWMKMLNSHLHSVNDCKRLSTCSWKRNEVNKDQFLVAVNLDKVLRSNVLPKEEHLSFTVKHL